jgi:hypothetical protein
MRFLRLGKAFGHEQLLNAQMDGGWSSKRLLMEEVMASESLPPSIIRNRWLFNPSISAWI